MKISFIASHGGSSAKHIISAMKQKVLTAELGVVITNNSDSESEDRAIMNALLEAQTDLVVLSGYMKKIGPHTLTRFNNHILNIHPALLPKHGGQGLYGDRVHEAVLKSGDKVSGASVHLINDHYDEGPVLKQSHVPVYPDDTVASLRARVQATEGDLYLETLKNIIEGTL